jgi:hypothetical protein
MPRRLCCQSRQLPARLPGRPVLGRRPRLQLRHLHGLPQLVHQLRGRRHLQLLILHLLRLLQSAAALLHPSLPEWLLRSTVPHKAVRFLLSLMLLLRRRQRRRLHQLQHPQLLLRLRRLHRLLPEDLPQQVLPRPHLLCVQGLRPLLRHLQRPRLQRLRLLQSASVPLRNAVHFQVHFRHVPVARQHM